jgi:Lrp/AsnC family transcriptional regulator for asnA, asnC and gidA
MDGLDSSIIEILRGDGRASNAGIARQVGVSEGTVRRRLKRLIDEQYIQVVALPDPVKMGLNSEALVGVQVDSDRVDEVADELAGLRGVDWVAVTTGPYDLFAWVTLESAEALGVFLRAELGIIRGVRRSETFVSLTAKRRGHGASV